MFMILSPRKAVVFDSGCSDRPLEIKRIVEHVLLESGHPASVEVVDMHDANRDCYQCTLWTAFGYYAASVSSLDALHALASAPSDDKQRALAMFHDEMLRTPRS